MDDMATRIGEYLDKLVSKCEKCVYFVAGLITMALITLVF